jgi:hypothetical protein
MQEGQFEVQKSKWWWLGLACAVPAAVLRGLDFVFGLTSFWNAVSLALMATFLVIWWRETCRARAKH